MAKRFTKISDVVHGLCDDACYTSKITLMQSLIQEIVQNKRHDMVVGSDLEGDEAVAAALFVISQAVVGNSYARASTPLRMVIVPQDTLLTAQAFISGLTEPANRPAVFGLTADAKDDLSQLRNTVPAIVATPSRLIDHLRRNNLSLEKVRCMCIVQPQGEQNREEHDSFSSDVQFIFAKLTKHVQSLLFCPSGDLHPTYEQFLTRPKTVSPKESAEQTLQAYWCEFETLTPKQVSNYIYAQQLSNVQIVCPQKAFYNEMLSYYKQSSPLYRSVITYADDTLTASQHCEHVVIAGLPQENNLNHMVTAFTGQLKSFGSHHFLTSGQQEGKKKIIQESYRMSNRKAPKDQEVLKGKIAALIDEVERDSNPEELNELRKMVKKAVPFYRRGYLTAYLLRELINSEDDSPNRGKKKQVDPELTATLFFGVGKNRRTFPKDIARLLKEQAGLDNSEILSIKTLDNYSFVTVMKEKAPEAIEKLNGLKHKGRPLVVNYAKSKARS
ncbi:MAG: DbpA RNA binding domain-containing protein [Spirochaetota bacterium]